MLLASQADLPGSLVLSSTESAPAKARTSASALTRDAAATHTVSHRRYRVLSPCGAPWRALWARIRPKLRKPHRSGAGRAAANDARAMVVTPVVGPVCGGGMMVVGSASQADVARTGGGLSRRGARGLVPRHYHRRRRRRPEGKQGVQVRHRP